MIQHALRGTINNSMLMGVGQFMTINASLSVPAAQLFDVRQLRAIVASNPNARAVAERKPGGWIIRIDTEERSVYLLAQRRHVRLLKTEKGVLAAATEVGAKAILVELD